MCHSPNHARLKADIEKLLKNVVQATSVVKRIEGVFRKDRQEILDGNFKQIDTADRAGTVSQLPQAVNVMMQQVYGNN